MMRLGYCLPLLLALSLSTPLWSQQQNPPPPPPPPPADAQPAQNPNAQPPKSWSGGMKCSDGKCTSTSDSSQGPDNSPSFPPDATQPEAPAGHTTADDNPFPEAVSKAAQQTAEKQGNSAAPPADQDGQDYSSSRSRLKGMDVLGNSQPDAKPSPPAFDPKLAAKDDKIGHFYLQTGDYAGAYSRYKEASQRDPGDAEAVFGLAEAARQLGKRDEAIQNYQLYIDAFPNGPRAKDIRKALKELAAAH